MGVSYYCCCYSYYCSWLSLLFCSNLSLEVKRKQFFITPCIKQDSRWFRLILYPFTMFYLLWVWSQFFSNQVSPQIGKCFQLAKFECSLACHSLKTNGTTFLTTRCANYLCTGFHFEIPLIFSDCTMFFKNVFTAQIRIRVDGILSTTYILAKITACWWGTQMFCILVSKLRGHLSWGMFLINVFVSLKGSREVK